MKTEKIGAPKLVYGVGMNEDGFYKLLIEGLK